MHLFYHSLLVEAITSMPRFMEVAETPCLLKFLLLFFQIVILRACILFIYFFDHTLRHVAYQFPNQGWNPCRLQWKYRILTTGPPGKSPPPDCHPTASFWRGCQIIWSHNINSDSWSKRDPFLSPWSDSGIDIGPHLCPLRESSPLSLGIIVSYVTLRIQQLSVF